MLIDDGTTVNLMSYTVFKKLGQEDDELMKTNLTLNSMELTIGSKSLTSLFFIIKVQGNHNVILGRDWIHNNRCIPSTLHQFLIQWIDDEIEVVHMDASAYIALADAMTNWQHGSAWKDLTGYNFLSVSKDGFIPVSVQPASGTRLGDVVFQ
jgi:hypothetical protein